MLQKREIFDFFFQIRWDSPLLRGNPIKCLAREFCVKDTLFVLDALSACFPN